MSKNSLQNDSSISSYQRMLGLRNSLSSIVRGYCDEQDFDLPHSSFAGAKLEALEREKYQDEEANERNIDSFFAIASSKKIKGLRLIGLNFDQNKISKFLYEYYHHFEGFLYNRVCGIFEIDKNKTSEAFDTFNIFCESNIPKRYNPIISMRKEFKSQKCLDKPYYQIDRETFKKYFMSFFNVHIHAASHFYFSRLINVEIRDLLLRKAKSAVCAMHRYPSEEHVYNLTMFVAQESFEVLRKEFRRKFGKIENMYSDYDEKNKIFFDLVEQTIHRLATDNTLFFEIVCANVKKEAINFALKNMSTLDSAKEIQSEITRAATHLITDIIRSSYKKEVDIPLWLQYFVEEIVIPEKSSSYERIDPSDVSEEDLMSLSYNVYIALVRPLLLEKNFPSCNPLDILELLKQYISADTYPSYYQFLDIHMKDKEEKDNVAKAMKKLSDGFIF